MISERALRRLEKAALADEPGWRQAVKAALRDQRRGAQRAAVRSAGAGPAERASRRAKKRRHRGQDPPRPVTRRQFDAVCAAVHERQNWRPPGRGEDGTE